MEREKWASRSTFVLAAIGSAVGLGSVWRFPGLVAKHGGGAFLLVYFIITLVLGIPLLMMEIAMGRKTKKGAPNAFRALNPKLEPIGWAATANAFVITTYYAAVFAWVIAMVFKSYAFVGMTGNTEAASGIFTKMTETTWNVSGYSIPWIIFVSLLVAWALIYYCIRNGAHSVGKVVKYTVFLPVIFLLIMAVKGIPMPGAMDGIKKLFIPDFSALSSVGLWVDAVGQVFYSLSIMMAIMFAYGSFLDDDSNIAVDTLIIAFSNMAVSILAGIVMFSTMGGVGMLDQITSSGIAAAFIVYPQAIVSLTSIGWINAIFGLMFYLCLAALAIDSAFSIVEGVSTAIYDKFGLSHKKTTIGVCIVAGIVSLLFATRAGVAWLDIIDNWTNQYNMLIIGVLECIAVGWVFNASKILDEINRNTIKFKLSKVWFFWSVKVIAPLSLGGLLCWNLYTLFFINNGKYGYPLWSEVIGGWVVTGLVFISGIIIYIVTKKSKRLTELSKKEPQWDEIK
ncbi:MAG TPA: sodium-dependent transporter [Oscillospiraceae bacterium]|nr:sodium-dependent transporter [Oscillospiraceae bacterium]